MSTLDPQTPVSYDIVGLRQQIITNATALYHDRAHAYALGVAVEGRPQPLTEAFDVIIKVAPERVGFQAVLLSRTLQGRPWAAAAGEVEEDMVEVLWRLLEWTAGTMFLYGSPMAVVY
ncbi:hypothetical protein LTR36_000801 [Oleoguttula mirabilis]|uniref:Uncharacterized protein n=1 Tax=Oleoguttula mirabilis TaxID=1507867 RepID=A0AAV9J3V7_9PEZI|nr:hypothetical protein LTR36_000801 [Oleoguttula mirabilis]